MLTHPCTWSVGMPVWWCTQLDLHTLGENLAVKTSNQHGVAVHGTEIHYYQLFYFHQDHC